MAWYKASAYIFWDQIVFDPRHDPRLREVDYNPFPSEPEAVALPGSGKPSLLSDADIFGDAPTSSPPAGPFEEGLTAYEQKDYATALRLLRPLADQGNTKAQFYLGLMYKDGHGAQQDDAQAMAWYRKAAKQGHASAQGNPGLMYERGDGVPQDDVQALAWHTLAAVSFPAEDADDRKMAADNRDRLAAKMTPAQIAEAQRLKCERT